MPFMGHPKLDGLRTIVTYPAQSDGTKARVTEETLGSILGKIYADPTQSRASTAKATPATEKDKKKPAGSNAEEKAT